MDIDYEIFIILSPKYNFIFLEKYHIEEKSSMLLVRQKSQGRLIMYRVPTVKKSFVQIKSHDKCFTSHFYITTIYKLFKQNAYNNFL